jgi:hypothetical protein
MLTTSSYTPGGYFIRLKMTTPTAIKTRNTKAATRKGPDMFLFLRE